jgi:glutaredoxin-like protein NrdH
MTLKEEIRMMTVTVIKKANCVQCTMTAKYLDKHHIAYSGISIESNPDALDEVKDMRYSSAPVVIVKVNGKVAKSWSGFRPDQITSLLTYTEELQTA